MYVGTHVSISISIATHTLQLAASTRQIAANREEIHSGGGIKESRYGGGSGVEGALPCFKKEKVGGDVFRTAVQTTTHRQSK